MTSIGHEAREVPSESACSDAHHVLVLVAPAELNATSWTNIAKSRSG